MHSRTLATALWIGLGVSVAGRALDLQWHATHDEFETGRDQVRAHWLAWLGALILLAVAARASARGRINPGLSAVLVGAALYTATAIWHFYEHTQHRDPDLPHLLLAVSQILMLGGALIAAVTARRRPVPTQHG